jgi:hypothetical protein
MLQKLYSIIFSSILVLAFLWTPNHACAEQNPPYTMADLEVLQERQNFEEFFQHARDIRPSARGKAWTTMVQAMSESYLRKLLQRPFISDKDFNVINMLSDWTTVKAYEGFLILRNKFGKKYFSHCFKVQVDKNDCYRKALEFIKRTPDQAQLATDIGHIIYQQRLLLATEQVVGMDLWPFFEKMAAGPYGEFYCHRPYFRDEVVKSIKRSIDPEDNDKQRLNKLNQIAHQDCWLKLIPYFKDKLYSDSFQQDLAYSLLKSKKSLTADEEREFLMLYLLNSPRKGELMELAWKQLKEIGKDFSKREQLLEQLKKKDPLPGKIFAMPSDKQKLVIIKALALNFPEYIDHYASTCLSFLEDGDKYPNGNPTVECRDLFRLAKNYKFLPGPVVLRYDKIRNFKLMQ